MSAKKNNEVLILGLTVAITGGFLLGGGWFALRSGALSGTNSALTQKTNPRVKVVLEVLGDTFSGYSTLRSPAFQGALSDRAIGLNYSDEFDQKARSAALGLGKADLIVTTLDQFLAHRPQGKIVALVDRTVGADAVVLNTQRFPQLKSLLDLETLVQQQQARGKRLKIVFAGDTPSEFLATVLDTQFDNFDLSDFEVERVEDASVAWETMQKDKTVAAAVLWEPFVARAQQQGNTVVLSSSDAPTTIVDVVVASDRVVQSNPEAVGDFVEAYYRHIDSSLQDKALLTRQIAADGNLQPAEAETVARGIQFFTSVEARDWMESGTLEKRIGAISSILVLSGRLDGVPSNPASLYTSQYLAPVATQTATLIDFIAADNPQLAQQLRGTTGRGVTKPVSAVGLQQAQPIGNLAVRGEIKFQTGSAQLTAQGQKTLDTLANQLAEFNPSAVAVKVQGHTSRTGSAAVNEKLSRDRAKVAVDYLKGQNLPHHFAAEGLGYSQSLPDTDPASPLNQRTVIRLVRLKS
ncbi:MAG: phosphate ABC transporter substrate-binding/OmpA family protein [Cyanobacteriota bacterium]|nr:phosphate ABC transporter substrate-binding/OmpA family protein [Cyanobacteriota bacterium]